MRPFSEHEKVCPLRQVILSTWWKLEIWKCKCFWSRVVLLTRVVVVVVDAHVQKRFQAKKGSKQYSRLHLTMHIPLQVICLIGDKIVVREVDHQRHKIGPTSKDWRRTESLEFKVDYVQVCIHTTFIHFEKRMKMLWTRAKRFKQYFHCTFVGSNVFSPSMLSQPPWDSYTLCCSSSSRWIT